MDFYSTRLSGGSICNFLIVKFLNVLIRLKSFNMNKSRLQVAVCKFLNCLNYTYKGFSLNCILKL